MLRSLEVPDETALAAVLTRELGAYLPAGADVVPWRRGADFTVFRVLSGAGEHVLRVPLREVTDSVYDGRVDFGEIVEREAHVHELLRTHGVPVAPLHGWGRARDPDRHSWMLFDRVAHDDVTTLTADTGRALGAVLRRLHAIDVTAHTAAIVGAETTPGALSARIEARVTALAERVAVTDADAVIEAALTVLRRREGVFEPCLTHMDLRVENLCFRAGELVAVLDLSNCTTGDPLAELGRMSAYGNLTPELQAAYADDRPDPVVVAAYAVDTYALLGLLGADEFADQELVDRGVAGLEDCLGVLRSHGLV